MKHSKPYNKLWGTFLKAKYYTLDEASKAAPNPNSDPGEKYASVFLSIARVYTLADYYDIKPLAALALAKLYRLLVVFTLHSSRVPDIVRLIEYTCDNTVDVDESQDRMRSLLYHYVACYFTLLWGNKVFRELMQKDSDLMAGVIERLMERLD